MLPLTLHLDIYQIFLTSYLFMKVEQIEEKYEKRGKERKEK